MSPLHLRHIAGAWAGRVAGQHPLPLGDVARDRRLLRRALRAYPVGKVLVVGPGLAARQALSRAADVAGTSPYSAEVNVCSTVLGKGSLPVARWDVVIVSDPGPNWPQRLAAVLPACRPGALLLVLANVSWAAAGGVRTLAAATRIHAVLGNSRRRLWITTVAI